MVPSGLGSSFKNFIASTTGRVDARSSGDVFEKHHGILGGQIYESVNMHGYSGYRCENLMYMLFVVI